MYDTKYKTVDKYIADAPKEIQPKLKALRKVIKATAPKAEEKISYGMPYYGLNGRLVYFASTKNHIGLYIPPPIIAQHAKELKGYGTTVSAVHLDNKKPLPIALIKKLVKARMKYNEIRKK